MAKPEDEVAEKFLAGLEKHFVTRTRLQSALKMVSKVFGKALRENVDKPLSERILAAEKRIAELEARPRMQYRGAWSQGEEYHVGDFVTDHGSLWHCNTAKTEARPGAPGSSDFTLAVKRGRDGS